MTTEGELTAEEFEQRVAEIENGDTENQEAEPELLEYSQLLEMRKDIKESLDALDETEEYWGNICEILEEQIDASKKQPQKREALKDTLGSARKIVARINNE